MTNGYAHHPALEHRLAQLLRYGTWLGSLVIAMGLVLDWFPQAAASSAELGTRIISLGVLLFIFLPVLRVTLMLGVFLVDRDYRFAAIAAIVLAVIASGAVLGMYLSGQW